MLSRITYNMQKQMNMKHLYLKEHLLKYITQLCYRWNKENKFLLTSTPDMKPIHKQIGNRFTEIPSGRLWQKGNLIHILTKNKFTYVHTSTFYAFSVLLGCCGYDSRGTIFTSSSTKKNISATLALMTEHSHRSKYNFVRRS